MTINPVHGIALTVVSHNSFITQIKISHNVTLMEKMEERISYPIISCPPVALLLQEIAQYFAVC